MSIQVSNNNSTNIYTGNNKVKEVWDGDKKVYGQGLEVIKDYELIKPECLKNLILYICRSGNDPDAHTLLKQEIVPIGGDNKIITVSNYGSVIYKKSSGINAQISANSFNSWTHNSLCININGYNKFEIEIEYSGSANASNTHWCSISKNGDLENIIIKDDSIIQYNKSTIISGSTINYFSNNVIKISASAHYARYTAKNVSSTGINFKIKNLILFN